MKLIQCVHDMFILMQMNFQLILAIFVIIIIIYKLKGISFSLKNRLPIYVKTLIKHKIIDIFTWNFHNMFIVYIPSCMQNLRSLPPFLLWLKHLLFRLPFINIMLLGNQNLHTLQNLPIFQLKTFTLSYWNQYEYAC